MRRATAELTGTTLSSDDGTAIGYLELGSGPGVVLLHGAMETARSHVDPPRRSPCSVRPRTLLCRATSSHQRADDVDGRPRVS